MTAPIQRSLWDHQHASWQQARAKFATGARCVLIQGVTGTGKTRLAAAMMQSAASRPARCQQASLERKRRLQSIWFVVPRKELIWQSSAELKEWGINHGTIAGKKKENPIFQSHVASRDTIIRRIRKGEVEQIPDVVFFDEAHIALDQQLEIKEAFPDTLFIGLTATPERLDGRPLKGMYDLMIEGAQLSEFVADKFLKAPWVLSVPQKDRITAEADLKFTKGGDLTRQSEQNLTELYKARAKGKSVMYGNEIEHYKKYGAGRSFVCFVRSIEQAEEVAAEFTAAGVSTEPIHGKMTDVQRKDKVARFKGGSLMGMTTVNLLAYGFDAPGASCAIMLRPTASVALFFQMIGRILRWDGVHTRGLILDHVGNCDDKKHGHPMAPRVWNFEGRQTRDKIPDGAIGKIEAVAKCPICYANITKRHQCKCGNIFDIGEKCDDCDCTEYKIVDSCIDCGALKAVKSRKPLKEIDGWLVEITGPEPLGNRPPENQREYQDRINSAVDRYRTAWYPSDTGRGGEINESAVSDLLDIAVDLKWKNPPVAVYKKLVPHSDMMVNTPLLTEIAKQKGYNDFWVKRQREFFELGLLSRERAQSRNDNEPPSWVASEAR